MWLLMCIVQLVLEALWSSRWPGGIQLTTLLKLDSIVFYVIDVTSERLVSAVILVGSDFS